MVDRTESLDLVTELLASYTGVGRDAITESTLLVDELGVDSVDAVELLITVERRVGRRFSLDQVEDLETVADIVDALATPDAGASAPASAPPGGGTAS